MRLSITHTKNNTYFYMIKSFRINGKNTTKIIECLGSLEDVVKKANGEDPREFDSLKNLKFLYSYSPNSFKVKFFFIFLRTSCNSLLSSVLRLYNFHTFFPFSTTIANTEKKFFKTQNYVELGTHFKNRSIFTLSKDYSF